MQPLGVVVNAVLGYFWQWTRSFKKVPNSFANVVFGIGAALGWYWMTPEADRLLHADWRSGLAQAAAGIIASILAARGSASTFSGTKLAPPTNSL